MEIAEWLRNMNKPYVAALVFMFLLGFCPKPSSAEYSIQPLGPLVSRDESLLTASRNGWVVVRDNDDPQNCEVLLKLGNPHTVRLCDKGLAGVSHVNEQGDVLGVTTDESRTPAVWSKRTGLKRLEIPESDGYDRVRATALNNKGDVVGYTTKEVREVP